MTRRERERVRRHAAVVAIASAPQMIPDAEADRWSALLRWHCDEAEGADTFLSRSQGMICSYRIGGYWPLSSPN